MTPNHCNQTTPSGHPCYHLASRCPFHPAPVRAPDDAAEPSAERPNPHRFIFHALQDAVEGKASPASVTRLVKTLAIAHRIGPPPLDADRIADEIALKGMTMHGIPPRTEAQWNLAREMFTGDSLHLFARWLLPFDPPPPEWLKDIPNPEDALFPPISAEVYDAYANGWKTPRAAPSEPLASGFDPNEPPLDFINPHDDFDP